MPPKERQPDAEPTVQDLLKALLLLANEERESRAPAPPSQVRTEVLLAEAGFEHRTVAAMLGKNPDAVRMAVTRAKKPAKTSAASPAKAPARKTASARKSDQQAAGPDAWTGADGA